jgi:hypothetical protein
MYLLNAPLLFTVPFSVAACALAEKFRCQQSTPQKAKQVYLNTLAVYAVDFYLKCIGIDTDVDHSDSHDPLFLQFMDVADLRVKAIGRLECRPVLANETVLKIPPECREDRVGYVAVQFDESLKQMKILGFTPMAAAEVPLSRLNSLEEFPEFLNQLRHRVCINVRQWFDDIFEGGWQAIDTLLMSPHFALAARTRDLVPSQIDHSEQSVLEARAWKVVELEQFNQKTSIVLVLMITPQQQGEGVEIRVQAYPGGSPIYLPPELQLSIQDHSTEICSAQARNKDNLLQLGFMGQPTEIFSITVTLGDSSVTESFSI